MVLHMPFAVFFDMLGSTRILSDLSDTFDFQPGTDCAENSEVATYRRYEQARHSFHGIRFPEFPESGLMFAAAFSDCKFLVYSTPATACYAAAHGMSGFYSTEIPVRAGIGYGNFRFDRSAQVIGVGGVITECSFYGSSVARAYAAERCGLKGFRVFVHSSAADALEAVHPGLRGYLEIDWDTFEEGQDRGPYCGALLDLPPKDMRADVRHELSFLHDHPVEEFQRGVERIRLRFPPSDSAAVHYDATLQALRRMEEARPHSRRMPKKYLVP